MKRTTKNGNNKSLSRTTYPGMRKSGKNKTGPKRKFTEAQLEDVRDLVKAGARTQELAIYFDVNTTTIEYWVKNYSDFRRARDKGKIDAIRQTGNSLFDKANGYHAPAVHFHSKKVKEFDEDGNILREYDELEKIPYMKYYPKDGNAAYRWLSIMFRDVWADVTKFQHNHQHSGEITERKVEELDVTSMSEKAQEVLFEIGLKQLGDGTSDN